MTYVLSWMEINWIRWNPSWNQTRLYQRYSTYNHWYVIVVQIIGIFNPCSYLQWILYCIVTKLWLLTLIVKFWAPPVKRSEFENPTMSLAVVFVSCCGDITLDCNSVDTASTQLMNTKLAPVHNNCSNYHNYS